MLISSGIARSQTILGHGIGTLQKYIRTRGKLVNGEVKRVKERPYYSRYRCFIFGEKRH